MILTPDANPTPTTAAATDSPPRRRVFRPSRAPMPRLDAARQARVMGLAWTAFGSRDGVMAFLNGDHAELGARPLDLAIASDAGLARVEQALTALGTPHS
jgi:uncharacterized protein (DUF2384 family)